jgi:hypothetical protein
VFWRLALGNSPALSTLLLLCLLLLVRCLLPLLLRFSCPLLLLLLLLRRLLPLLLRFS